MKRVRNHRDIFDRRVLGGFLNDLAAAKDVRTPAARGEILVRLKELLAAGRAEVRRRFEEAGASGHDTARANSYLIDQILRTLYDFTVTHIYPSHSPTASERLGVVAVGGYGRAEMAPFSDVDLLFLLPYKQTPWGEQVVEYLLYLLWDLGLKVGHATRSIDDCVRLSKADLTIRTSILEARYLCGDEALFADLRRRYLKDVVAGTEPEFTELKLAERDERHRKFGESRYLVEPNIKEGKGGLRDLHTLFWIAKYVYQVQQVSELVELEVLTASELRRFAKAEAFLWRVRCHLHYLTGRAEERLTFDVQAEIGRRLNYADRSANQGVERFMKHYYLIAKEVGDLTRIICASLEEQHKRPARFRLLRLPKLPKLGGLRRQEVDGFVIEGGRVDLKEADLFETDPVAILRLFRLAQERRVDIHPGALKAVTRNLKRIDGAMRKDSDANRLFLEILTSKDDPETSLRRLNEAGVFGRFVRDFGRVVAQMQHDMYHVYTVDEHTIRAVGMLAQIEAGLLEDEHPLSHEIVHKVLSREVLYVAVMLHDIAKGRGGDHAELGAQVAQKLCPRLGLSAEDTETVAWLVLHHLDMSRTAFKRDLQDPKTITDFVETVQDLERLRLLLVLTVADIRAVGPGRWNGWKGQLLRELYQRTEEALSGGMSGEGAKQRVEGAKIALREALSDWPEAEIARQLGRGYDSYWLGAETGVHVRDANLMRRADADGAGLTIDTYIDRFQAVTEVTVFAADHAGLFSRIAGAIAVAGFNVVHATIFTTTDGMALDTFWVQEPRGGAVTEPARLKKLTLSIEDTLAGRINIEQALADQAGPPSRSRAIRVAQRVQIDNKASNVYTVVEVSGRDRRGLLHDITRAFADMGLSVASARIATYGARASDVFYVKDVFGLKVTNAGKLRSIEARLRTVLEGRKPEVREAAKKSTSDASATAA
jgi:[protein-PII] uridylyltransferase